MGLKEGEGSGENIFGCQRIFFPIYNKGVKDLHQKAMSTDVVEQIRKTFPDSERLEVRTVWLHSQRDFQLAKRRMETLRWSN